MIRLDRIIINHFTHKRDTTHRPWPPPSCTAALGCTSDSRTGREPARGERGSRQTSTPRTTRPRGQICFSATVR